MVARTELAGLPAGGPATLPDVKTWLGITHTNEDARLTALVDAVNVQVRRFPVAEAAVDAASWPDDITVGASMLVARLWRRKDNPDGVMVFGEGAVAYIRRNDPDIAMLLGLGGSGRPKIG